MLLISITKVLIYMMLSFNLVVLLTFKALPVCSFHLSFAANRGDGLVRKTSFSGGISSSIPTTTSSLPFQSSTIFSKLFRHNRHFNDHHSSVRSLTLLSNDNLSTDVITEEKNLSSLLDEAVSLFPIATATSNNKNDDTDRSMKATVEEITAVVEDICQTLSVHPSFLSTTIRNSLSTPLPVSKELNQADLLTKLDESILKASRQMQEEEEDFNVATIYQGANLLETMRLVSDVENAAVSYHRVCNQMNYNDKEDSASSLLMSNDIETNEKELAERVSNLRLRLLHDESAMKGDNHVEMNHSNNVLQDSLITLATPPEIEEVNTFLPSNNILIKAPLNIIENISKEQQYSQIQSSSSSATTDTFSLSPLLLSNELNQTELLTKLDESILKASRQMQEEDEETMDQCVNQMETMRLVSNVENAAISYHQVYNQMNDSDKEDSASALLAKNDIEIDEKIIIERVSDLRLRLLHDESAIKGGNHVSIKHNDNVLQDTLTTSAIAPELEIANTILPTNNTSIKTLSDMMEKASKEQQQSNSHISQVNEVPAVTYGLDSNKVSLDILNTSTVSPEAATSKVIPPKKITLIKIPILDRIETKSKEQPQQKAEVTKNKVNEVPVVTYGLDSNKVSLDILKTSTISPETATSKVIPPKKITLMKIPILDRIETKSEEQPQQKGEVTENNEVIVDVEKTEKEKVAIFLSLALVISLFSASGGVEFLNTLIG